MLIPGSTITRHDFIIDYRTKAQSSPFTNTPEILYNQAHRLSNQSMLCNVTNNDTMHVVPIIFVNAIFGQLANFAMPNEGND